jgi:Arc/MetJ-type ribon-helix-helix transcriptional regulator
VTLDVPIRILKDLRLLVDAGVYLSVDEALRESIVANWRFIRGSYLSVRIEPKDAVADEAEAGEAATVESADMADDTSVDPESATTSGRRQAP